MAFYGKVSNRILSIQIIKSRIYEYNISNISYVHFYPNYNESGSNFSVLSLSGRHLSLDDCQKVCKWRVKDVGENKRHELTKSGHPFPLVLFVFIVPLVSLAGLNLTVCEGIA